MKTILHCDANNFYASVETCLEPTLKGKPLAVTGDPDKRHGIILAKNEIAKKAGVKTGDVIWEAKRKCPGLELRPACFDRYMAFSKRLFALYNEYTDRVESFGIDECWLDVTHSRRLFGDGETIAQTLRERVKRELGLTISVGVSFTKTFAKLGSDYKKPDAVTVISPDNFRRIVWPLPVSDMLMIGRKTALQLRAIGIETIGDLAAADARVLEVKFGVNGRKYGDDANGRGDDEVRLSYDRRVPKSVGNSTTMPRDIVLRRELQAVLTALAEMVASRLRRSGFKAKGVHFGVRYGDDLSFCGKQSKLGVATASADRLRDAALSLYDNAFASQKRPIRLVSLTAYDLIGQEECEQLSLFEDAEDCARRERLTRSLDVLRAKYGYGVLKSAAVMEYPVICEDLEDSEYVPFQR